MAYTPLEKIWETVDNRYFAVIIAAREARRINKASKEDQKDEKPTLLALRKLIRGDIAHTMVEED